MTKKEKKIVQLIDKAIERRKVLIIYNADESFVTDVGKKRNFDFILSGLNITTGVGLLSTFKHALDQENFIPTDRMRVVISDYYDEHPKQAIILHSAHYCRFDVLKELFYLSDKYNVPAIITSNHKYFKSQLRDNKDYAKYLFMEFDNGETKTFHSLII